MQDFMFVKGMIIHQDPIGDYDRRVVILTKEHGKISAFAKGARRPNNKLMAVTDLFCFGDFKLYVGKESYSVIDATIKNYFEDLRVNLNSALYGMYFLEVMEYNTREDNDEVEMLKLLYTASNALLNDAIANDIVKVVFELKALVLSGEFLYSDREKYKKVTSYTVDFITNTKPERLFSFTVANDVLEELKIISKVAKDTIWHHSFNSEEMLKMVEM